MKEMLELLFSVTLSTNVFIIAILILRFLFKNSSKNSRLFLWLLVGIKLILLFNIECKFSLIPKSVAKITSELGNVTTDVVLSQVESMSNSVNTEVVFYVVWAIVASIILIYGVVSFWRLHKNIGDAIKMEGNIFQSEKVVSPFVLGVIKPKIYIPFNLEDETLSHIVSHEKSHIKNIDHITKLVAFLLLAVHWFNPLVWVCFKLFTKDIELACDERVIKNYSLEKRKSYAEALLNCAVNEGRGLIYPVAFGEVSVKDRIKSVVSYKKTLKIVLALFLCVATVSFVLFATVPEVSAKNETKEKAITEEKVIEQTVPEETTTEVLQEETTTGPVTESYQEYYNDPYYEENVEFHEEEYSEKSYEEEPEYSFTYKEIYSGATVNSASGNELVVNNRDLELEKNTVTNPASYNNSYNNNSYNNNSGFYNSGIVGGKSNANYFDDFPVISWDPMYP